MFAVMALPPLKADNGDTPNPADLAKAAKIALRLRLAAEDAEPIIQRHNIREKFALASDS